MCNSPVLTPTFLEDSLSERHIILGNPNGRQPFDENNELHLYAYSSYSQMIIVLLYNPVFSKTIYCE